jgi:prevent-host-death family protein
MVAIPATEARQQWARTLELAHREPVTITQHGRDSVIILDAEIATRALAALQDADDAAAADAARAEIGGGQSTVSLEELAAELGIVLD